MDESMLTGESLPVEKSPGDKLYAGTLNVNGRLQFRVTATGEATALAQIIAAVSRAQDSRAEIQRLGDRVSSVFVPIVVAIAIAAALWTSTPRQRRTARAEPIENRFGPRVEQVLGMICHRRAHVAVRRISAVVV